MSIKLKDTIAGRAETTYGLSPTTGRVASANKAIIGDGVIRSEIVSSSMTTAPPPVGEGHLLTFDWDNTAGWSSQIGVGRGHLALRGMNSKTWGDWNTVLDSSNFRQYTIAPSATITSDSTKTLPYHLLAQVKNITGSYKDSDAVILLNQGFSGGRFGIIKLSQRTSDQSSKATSSSTAYWLTRKGFDQGDIVVARYTSDTSSSTDYFLYTGSNTYYRGNAYLLSSPSSGMTLISSAETASNTGTNCYASLEAACIALHGASTTYASTATATDGGVVETAYKLAHSKEITAASDWNNLSAGVYKISGFTFTTGNHHPFTGMGKAAHNYGTLIVYNDGSNNCVQQYIENDTGKMFIRSRYSSSYSWKDWNEFYGTYQTQDGLTDFPDVKAWRFGNVCTVEINGAVGNVTSSWANIHLMTLPVGMRPYVEVATPVVINNKGYSYNAMLKVATDGKVYFSTIGGTTPAMTSSDVVHGCITFVTTG